MPRMLKLSFAMCLLSVLVAGGQVQETKAPLSGQGCADVTGKLKKLTVGRMKVKTCCRGMVLSADVKLQDGKKAIEKWYVQDADGQEVKAEKGRDDANGSMVIRTEDGKACFIVERKPN